LIGQSAFRTRDGASALIVNGTLEGARNILRRPYGGGQNGSKKESRSSHTLTPGFKYHISEPVFQAGIASRAEENAECSQYGQKELDHELTVVARCGAGLMPNWRSAQAIDFTIR
jgi:hypothetical protein